MSRLRKFTLAALAAPLALGLASCDSAGDGAGEVPQGEPVASVAPPEGQLWSDVVSVTEHSGHVIGNPDAPIKLIEYGSLTCPACANFAVTGVTPLREKYVDSGRVSFELRNFAIHGMVDLVLARLVRCGAPEAVHPLSDQVWANVAQLTEPLRTNPDALEQVGDLPMEQRFVAFAQRAGYIDFFAARGLSADQAASCLADVASMQKLADETSTQAKEFDITGTPTFFLNGVKIDGSNWASVEAALQRAGAR